MYRVRRSWACLLLALAGCREELGPESLPTTRVSGIVVEGGKPVGGGWIEFIPVEGTVGNLRSAPIHPDGTFETDGVAVGRNLVGFAHAPIRLANPRRFSPFASPIRRDVPPGPSTRLTIDLVEETMRAKRDRPTGG
jgi:hypothetical protein